VVFVISTPERKATDVSFLNERNMLFVVVFAAISAAAVRRVMVP
jgi:hypothetical protein